MLLSPFPPIIPLKAFFLRFIPLLVMIFPYCDVLYIVRGGTTSLPAETMKESLAVYVSCQFYS